MEQKMLEKNPKAQFRREKSPYILNRARGDVMAQLSSSYL